MLNFNIHTILANTYFELLKVNPPFLPEPKRVWLHQGNYIYYLKFPGKPYNHIAIYNKNDDSIVYFQVAGPGGKQGQLDFQETIQKRFKQRMCRL